MIYKKRRNIFCVTQASALNVKVGKKIGTQKLAANNIDHHLFFHRVPPFNTLILLSIDLELNRLRFRS